MSGAYDVGYGRPPRETRFRKGQSGNPAGRPRRKAAPSPQGHNNIDEIIAEALARPVSIVEGGQKRQVSAREAIVTRQVHNALGGNRHAARDLIALGAAAERERQAEDDERYRYWQEFVRHWGASAPLNWPPPARPLYPHPRDILFDPARRQVTFLGAIEAQEAPLFLDLIRARDLCLLLAEHDRRYRDRDDVHRQHLSDAVALHRTLPPSCGGPYSGEAAGYSWHRLAATAMETRLLARRELRERIAVNEAALHGSQMHVTISADRPPRVARCSRSRLASDKEARWRVLAMLAEGRSIADIADRLGAEASASAVGRYAQAYRRTLTELSAVAHGTAHMRIVPTPWVKAQIKRVQRLLAERDAYRAEAQARAAAPRAKARAGASPETIELIKREILGLPTDQGDG